ncbi:MAG: hypothetical protein IJ200_03430 [Prevotella sp.]|nr:hypothetical protein [Prevotella sp.]
MKKLFLVKSLLLLCALVAGSGSVWADTTYKLTKVTSVEDGGLYVFEQDGYVMNNTVSSSALQTTNSYKTTGLTGSETYVWQLIVQGSSTNYYMKNVSLSSNYYLANSSTSVSFKPSSTDAGVWSFTFQTDETVIIQNTKGDNRFLGYTNSTSHAYKAYATSNLNGTTYPHAINVYKLVEEDDREEAGLAYAPTSVTLKLGDAFTAPTFSNPNELDVSYSSDNSSVATVHPTNGTITFVGGLGTAVITATSEENTTYQAGQATFTINVIRKTPTLLVSDNLNMNTGESITIDDEIYLTDSDGDVTITSGTPAVVSVAEGKLNALTEGTAIITVNVAQSDTYAAASESFVITVTANPTVTPEGQSVGGGYTLVTDASTLAEGDEIILVSSATDGTAYALSTTQNTNNRAATSVTISSNSIANLGNAVQVITLEGNATNGWYFNVGTGYLYAASNDNNYLRTETESDDNAKATISINNSGAATITFQGTNSRKLMRFNPNTSNNNPLFSCYATNSTTGNTPYIFRRNQATSFDIEVGSTGWRTLVSAHDVASLPSGLKAYTVTESSSASVKLTEVTEIAKDTPYLLEGDADTYTLTISSDAVTAPTDNLLRISNATTGNGVYVLAKDGDNVGFYKWTGGYIGAGRVYLPAPAAGARQFLAFSFGESTGITANKREAISNNEYYNLNGQRVAQPTKGLYIVNGKKFIVK